MPRKRRPRSKTQRDYYDIYGKSDTISEFHTDELREYIKAIAKSSTSTSDVGAKYPRGIPSSYHSNKAITGASNTSYKSRQKTTTEMSKEPISFSKLFRMTVVALCISALVVTLYAGYLYYFQNDTMAAVSFIQHAPLWMGGRTENKQQDDNDMDLNKFTIVQTSIKNTVSKKFISFSLNLDSLKEYWKWKELDLEIPQLQSMLYSLKPAYFRIGGHASNTMYFTKVSSVSKLPPGNVSWKEYKLMSNVKQVRVDEDDIVKINSFCQKYGWEILFSLNLLQRSDVLWDPTNAMHLFRFAHSRNISIHWSLGNNPELAKLSPEIISRDYESLRHIANDWALPNSLIVGPELSDVSSSTSKEFLTTFLRTKPRRYIDVISVHYNATMENYLELSSNVINFTNADKFRENLKEFVSEVKAALQSGEKKVRKRAASQSVRIWLTSLLPPKVSSLNSFLSALLWADLAGIAAEEGIEAVFLEEAILGSNSLFRMDNYHPLPLFWISVFYKRLMGEKVLRVKWPAPQQEQSDDFKASPSNDKSIRVYGHCLAKGSFNVKSGAVVVMVINGKAAMQTLHLHPENLRTSKIYKFVLTADKPDGILGQDLLLNGKPLELKNNFELPQLSPIVQKPSSEILLEAFSVGFFIFPEAAALSCEQ